MTFTLSDLVRGQEASLVLGQPATSISGISIDTRTLRPGEAFFALSGPHFDGHHFVVEAAERGAAAVVVERMDDHLTFRDRRAPAVVHASRPLNALQDLARVARQRLKGQVIGISGSNGKTTTKEMLTAILRETGTVGATRGNLNNHIGLPLTLCELSPEAAFVVLELGTSQPGDMELLVDLAKPQIGLLTNVGKDHLEFVGTPEGMLAVNRPLLDKLPADGTAVINLDDPLLAPLAKTLTTRVVSFGMAPHADVRAENIRPAPLPLRFDLCIGDLRQEALLPLPGRLQVYNALAAAATAHAAGIPLDTIVRGLLRFRPAPLRMQVREHPGGATLVNDAYNANPSSMRSAIESFLETFPQRPRWLVLGDMRELGTAARAEHESLGAWLAGQPVQRLFLYGRDTRHLEAGWQAAARSGTSTGTVERLRKKRYLVDRLRRALGEEKPAILFKASRAMKLEQVVEALR